MWNRHLLPTGIQPMNPQRGEPRMQVTVTVSDEYVSDAASSGLSVVNYVESLITKGHEVTVGRPAVETAMDRIRALRFPVIDAKK
jgi:hypothetical protein